MKYTIKGLFKLTTAVAIYCSIVKICHDYGYYGEIEKHPEWIKLVYTFTLVTWGIGAFCVGIAIIKTVYEDIHRNLFKIKKEIDYTI